MKFCNGILFVQKKFVIMFGSIGLTTLKILTTGFCMLGLWILKQLIRCSDHYDLINGAYENIDFF